MANHQPTKPEEYDAFIHEVGVVAANWASLEFQMDFLIWELAEVEHMLGACITSQTMNTSAKLRTIIALLRIREYPDSFIKELNQFDSKTAVPREARNRIVHCPWGYGEHSGGQMRAIIKNKALEFGWFTFKLSEIQHTSLQIKALNDEFDALRKRILNWSSTSPNKWRLQLRRIQAIPVDTASPGTAP